MQIPDGDIIWKLKLHEKTDLEPCIWVMRVASGWLYGFHRSASHTQVVFVPFIKKSQMEALNAGG